MSIREVNFTYRDSEKYQRVFSNSNFLQHGIKGEAVIDFSEEFVEPRLIVHLNLDDEVENEIYNRDTHTVEATVERKCTVTMSVEQALDLAESIIEKFSQENDRDD